MILTLIFLLIVVIGTLDCKYNYRYDRLKTGESIIWYNNHGRYSEGRSFIKIKDILKKFNL